MGKDYVFSKPFRQSQRIKNGDNKKMIVLLFFVLISFYGHSMQHQNLLVVALEEYKKIPDHLKPAPIVPILENDTETALSVLKAHPETAHQKMALFASKIYKGTITPFQAAFIKNNRIILDHIIATQNPPASELHKLLYIAARISDIINTEAICHSAIYLIEKWNTPVYQEPPYILPQQVIEEEAFLRGSVFSIYLSRLILMPSDHIETFPWQLGEKVINCLLKAAKKENLTTKQFTDFTQFHRPSFWGDDKLFPPYQILISRHVITYSSAEKEEDIKKHELRRDFLFSLFKIFLKYIPFYTKYYTVKAILPNVDIWKISSFHRWCQYEKAYMLSTRKTVSR